MILQNYRSPSSIEEAFQLLNEEKSNLIIGGGAWLKLQNSEINTVIDLSKLGLDSIVDNKDSLEIGAMVTLRELETSKAVRSIFDGVLSKAINSIMGMNVRNIATIGGSIMGRFSFSDIFTPLLVLDTTLVFHNAGEVSLEDFLNDKKFPKDILLAIRIKKESGKGYFKTVKKTALDFAILNIAITNGNQLKIAVGSRPGRAVRAIKTEQLIERNIDNMIQTVLEEISLSSNFRAGKEYREDLLKAYIKRGLEEVL